jgi:hypothetical protein
MCLDFLQNKIANAVECTTTRKQTVTVDLVSDLRNAIGRCPKGRHVSWTNLTHSLRPIILFTNTNVSMYILVIDTSVFMKSNVGGKK